MGQGVGVLLPVLAVKVDYGYRFRWIVQAAQIDVDTIRIGARDIERFDTTYSTEGVLGSAGIKGVGLQ